MTGSRPWGPDEVAFITPMGRLRLTTYQVFNNLRRAGFERSFSSVERKVHRMVLDGKLAPKTSLGQRIGYLDIESTGLKADFGFMLSWAIKVRDKNKVYSDHIHGGEIRNSGFDRRIVGTLIDAMRKFDTVVTFYGTRFDLPFARTRALKCGLRFPGYSELHHIDVYYLCREKLSLRSRRLSVVCQYLGIRGKTQLEPDVWMRAAYGDSAAIGYVLRHNIADVRILERAHKRLEGFSRGVIRSV